MLVIPLLHHGEVQLAVRRDDPEGMLGKYTLQCWVLLDVVHRVLRKVAKRVCDDHDLSF